MNVKVLIMAKHSVIKEEERDEDCE